MENELAKLPRMIIIGAAKSGTTSCHHYLRQHPNISLPWRKETHFFVADKEGFEPTTEYFGKIFESPITDIHNYLNEFDDQTGEKTRVEVCPSYIFLPNAATNIHNRIPNAIIVAILRNPVERFFSDYKFMTMNGKLDDQSRQYSAEKFDQDVRSLADGKADIRLQAIFERGKYASLLARFKARFPVERLKIHLYEELNADPNGFMNTLINYIDLPYYKFDTSQKFMVSGSLRGENVYKLFKGSSLTKRLTRLLPTRFYQKVRSGFESTTIKKESAMPETARGILFELYQSELTTLKNEYQLPIDDWFITTKDGKE